MPSLGRLGVYKPSPLCRQNSFFALPTLMILKTKKIGETIWNHEFLFEIHHGGYGYPESVLAGKQHKKSLNSTCSRALYYRSVYNWWCQNTERTMFYLMIYLLPQFEISP